MILFLKGHPMIRLLALVAPFLLSFASEAAMPEQQGTWMASVEEARPERLYVHLRRSSGSGAGGSNIDVASFDNLDRDQIEAAAATPVRFKLRREAGDISFEGSFRNGKGNGSFAFSPSPSYGAELRALGIREALDTRLISLSLIDLTSAHIQALQAEGFRLPLEKYVEMRIFDVTPSYVREIRSLGFNLSQEQFVEGRMYGVTPAFIEQMRKAGYRDVGFDKLVEVGMSGIDPTNLGDPSRASRRKQPAPASE